MATVLLESSLDWLLQSGYRSIKIDVDGRFYSMIGSDHPLGKTEASAIGPLVYIEDGFARDLPGINTRTA